MDKPLTNDDVAAKSPKLVRIIMHEIDSRVQSYITKQFATIDSKIERILELINQLDQNTSAELKEIKALLNQIRNEPHTSVITQKLSPQSSTLPLTSPLKLLPPCSSNAETSQSTKTMTQSSVVHSSSVVSVNQPQLIKPSDPKTGLLQALKRAKQSKTCQSIKTMAKSSTVIEQSSPSVASTKETRQDILNKQQTSCSETNVPLTSPLKLSTPCSSNAETSQSTKTMTQSLVVHSSSAIAAVDQPQLIKPCDPKTGLLQALKRAKQSKTCQSIKTLPQSPTVLEQSSLSVVASTEEARHNILSKQQTSCSETSLPLTSPLKLPSPCVTTKQKTEEYIPDLASIRPDLIDL